MQGPRMLILFVFITLGSGCDTKTGSSEQRQNDEGRIILVTGATGTQGGAVARALIGRGYLVRALTRNPQKPAALALATLGAEVVTGNFDDADSLASAMENAHGVFAVTNFWEHGYEKEVAHGQQLIDAAKEAGVRHFVFTSVAGAGDHTGIPHFDSKFDVERYLQDSGLNYSVVRPVSFMDNWKWERDALLAGEFADALDPDVRHQWIAAKDIGFFVAEAFDKPKEWMGRTEEIAGDEMTIEQLGDVLSEVLGRPVAYKQLTWETYQEENGEEMTVMQRWFADEGYSVDVTALRKQYPNLTRAKDYLETLLKPTS